LPGWHGAGTESIEKVKEDLNMHMDRNIFNLKVSLEATSAYILICSLLDQGHAPTLQQIRSLWNGSEDTLRHALLELMERQVLSPAKDLPEDYPLNVFPGDKWKWDLTRI
jgi:hypothetical protein